MPTRQAKTFLAVCALVLACGMAAGTEADNTVPFAEYWAKQWDLLNKHIEWSGSKDWMIKEQGNFLRPTKLVNGVANLPYPPEAGLNLSSVYQDNQCLIWESDRDALDILLRRTVALMQELTRKFGLKMETESAAIEAIRNASAKVAIGDPGRKELFLQLCPLQRQVALRNPLLDFDEVLVMNGDGGTPAASESLMQYIQFARRGNKSFGPMAISDWKTLQPKVRRVLPDRFRLGDADVDLSSATSKNEPKQGASFHACYDLSFDGKTLLFAAGAKPTCIYRYDFCAEDVVRLTDGNHLLAYQPRIEKGRITSASSGYPCWLPDGRIVFSTERDGKGDRCGGVTDCLWSMKADGSDAFPISWHETPESHPVVDHDGKLIYTRWDYIDREFGAMHSMWTCFPDGRDPRSIRNYALPHYKGQPAWQFLRPAAEWQIRPVPGEPGKYVAIASEHHIILPGVPILIDTNQRDDSKYAQTRILVGHMLPTESFGGGGVGRSIPAPGFRYMTPWPLSSDFHLISDMKNIVLLDSCGNVVPLLCWNGPGPLCSPRPLRARTPPPVIPTMTWQGERRNRPEHRRATISIQNVYDADFAWPAGVVEEKRIKSLRVIQIVPRPVVNWGMEHTGGPSGLSIPRMVLGTVPVEEDGSVHFEVPVEKLLTFQVLDAQGMAIQGMKSGTYVHPGEQLSCQGCHEDKQRSPAIMSVATAMRRPPSKLQPDVDGSLPLSFARLVQPVFENKCVACHKKEGKGPLLNLSFDQKKTPGRRPGHYHIGSWGWGPGKGYRSEPYQIGAHASGLGKTLLKSHLERLTPEEFHRVTLWLDCNSMRYSAFHDPEAQDRGEIVWPVIDCDPKNPQGVEKDRPLAAPSGVAGTP